MSSRKLIPALALLAFAGGAWADNNTEPKRDTQPAAATSQGKQETKAPQSSATPQPAAAQAPAPVETRDTAPGNDAYAPRERRHAGTTPEATDFASKYYPGG